MRDEREPSVGRLLPFRSRSLNEPWVTKLQLARHLQVSEKTVERWIADGMPCLRGKRLVRFQISRCEAWLDGKR